MATQFEIVQLTPTGSVPLVEFGILENGEKAAEIVKMLQVSNPGKKFRPNPIRQKKGWREREQERFNTGQYKPLDLDDFITPIPDHFVHKSINPLAQDAVAFTENEDSGQKDRQKRLPLRKYLRTYYQLSEEKLREAIWKYTGFDPAKDLHIATTDDEVTRVYENGPGSCMAHDASDWELNDHPATVYAGPDLAVAYTTNEDDSGITSRAVIWPEKKIFGRIYGDTQKLEAALDAHGYRRGFPRDWDGARLKTKWVESWDFDDEEYREGYLCAYVDVGCGYASYDEASGYLVIDRFGIEEIRCVFGVSSKEDVVRCDECQHSTNYGSYTNNSPGKYICYRCLEAEHGYIVDHGSTITSDADRLHYIKQGYVELTNKRLMSREVFNDHGFTCPVTNQNLLKHEGVIRESDGALVAKEALNV